MSGSLDQPQAESSGQETDCRLYIPHHDEFRVDIKRGWEKAYCYSKNPGEDWFHLLLSGEIYLVRADEKYCLTCARRLGFISHDRLYWQHGGYQR